MSGENVAVRAVRERDFDRDLDLRADGIVSVWVTADRRGYRIFLPEPLADALCAALAPPVSSVLPVGQVNP